MRGLPWLGARTECVSEKLERPSQARLPCSQSPTVEHEQSPVNAVVPACSPMLTLLSRLAALLQAVATDRAHLVLENAALR